MEGGTASGHDGDQKRVCLLVPVCVHTWAHPYVHALTHTHMFLSFLIFWVSSLFFLLFSSFLGLQCISFPSFSFFFFGSIMSLLPFSFYLSLPSSSSASPSSCLSLQPPSIFSLLVIVHLPPSFLSLRLFSSPWSLAASGSDSSL